MELLPFRMQILIFVMLLIRQRHWVWYKRQMYFTQSWNTRYFCNAWKSMDYDKQILGSFALGSLERMSARERIV